MQKVQTCKSRKVEKYALCMACGTDFTVGHDCENDIKK